MQTAAAARAGNVSCSSARGDPGPGTGRCRRAPAAAAAWGRRGVSTPWPAEEAAAAARPHRAPGYRLGDDRALKARAAGVEGVTTPVPAPRRDGADDPGSPRIVTLAAVQFAVAPGQPLANLATAERLVRRAAQQGANVILLPELFEDVYFCAFGQRPADLVRARERAGHPTLARFAALARELRVVLPISFYERAGTARFNSVDVLDADGTSLGLYRKSHIPDGAGYQEKYHFSPGDTGIRVFRTRSAGILGLGICWDQWFPEVARSLALQGAEYILYPTAIGSEPLDPAYDSAPHWRRVQQGHAAANLLPVVAANRTGTESPPPGAAAGGAVGGGVCFYGSSFIAGPTGELVAEAGRAEESILVATFDLDAGARLRDGWGVFRDRRPELYGALATMDGRVRTRAMTPSGEQ